MGERNTPEQQRAYNRAAEERRRQAGFRRRTVIVHEEDWPEVQRLVAALKRKRQH